MRGAPFDYVRADTVEEVVQTLDQANGEGKILAGGQSLASVPALRKARPAVLVDVNRIPGLAMIRPGADPSGSVEVGALVRHSMLVGQTDHPLLAEAARWIGHAAIRSRGTTVPRRFGGRSAPIWSGVRCCRQASADPPC
jgi:carbon-monoxide dehydrogenase medium subunit